MSRTECRHTSQPDSDDLCHLDVEAITAKEG